MGTLLAEEMKKRIMVLDGAMGTMIQTYKFEEEDFRGKHNLSGLCACVCVCLSVSVYTCAHTSACMYVCNHACMHSCDISSMVLCRGGI